VGVALTAAFIGIVGSSVYVRMQEMEAEEETDEMEITSQSGSDTAPDSSGDSA
jgi:hypothetical protein